MKERSDLAAGWLKKAQSDLIALESTLQAESFDAACFHGQQAAEKFLKAFLVHSGKPFPFTHNLKKLVQICASRDDSFRELLPLVRPLTPYAVELRYDTEYWPARDEAEAALSSAKAVRDFVLKRLPVELIALIKEKK
jgi:HEPN domain-containing protein